MVNRGSSLDLVEKLVVPVFRIPLPQLPDPHPSEWISGTRLVNPRKRPRRFIQSLLNRSDGQDGTWRRISPYPIFENVLFLFCRTPFVKIKNTTCQGNPVKEVIIGEPKDS